MKKQLGPHRCDVEMDFFFFVVMYFCVVVFFVVVQISVMYVCKFLELIKKKEKKKSKTR